MREETYCGVMQNAAHYQALGMNEIYLANSNIKGELPWQHVISLEPGGTHRLDISTKVWFRAKEPKTGITFCWSFDIEPHSANGSGGYHIDVQSCREVLALLPSEARASFREYLGECAKQVKAKGDEWMQFAMKQQKDAAILQDLVNAEVCAEHRTTAKVIKPSKRSKRA